MAPHIAIIKYSYNKSGGLEKQTNLIIEALKKKGLKVTLVTTKPKEKKNLPDGVAFHFINRWPFFSFIRILLFERQTKRWLKKNNFQAILAIDRTTFQTHIRAGNGVHRAYLENRKKYLGKINYLLTRINPLHQIILKIEKKAFENPFLKKIIVNSEMVKSQILKYFTLNPEKIKVILNGVEWEKFASPFLEGFSKKKQIKEKLGIDPEKFIFLFVGSGYKRKGLYPILLAASKIENKNFQIIIIGKDKKLNKYKNYSKKLGLGNNFLFFGKQEDLIPFYQVSDSLILPSFYDPFANVTIEALAMGLFTITSRENGASEIINRRNGIIINDLKDTFEIQRCLESTMKKPKNFDFSLSIRNSVEHLEIKNQLDKIIDLLLPNE